MGDVKPDVKKLQKQLTPAPVVKLNPHPAARANFNSSFESFLLTTKAATEAESRKRTNSSSNHSSTTQKTSGDSKKTSEAADSSKADARECENCPALVHLMFNHLVEISRGKLPAIQAGISESEIVQHLAEALGFSGHQIGDMIKASVNPYRCMFCPKTYPTKAELKDHKSTDHLNISTLPCPDCNRWFKTEENLRAHSQRFHKPVVPKDYPCPVTRCTNGYMKFGALKHHIQKKHPEIPLPPDLLGTRPKILNLSRNRKATRERSLPGKKKTGPNVKSDPRWSDLDQTTEEEDDPDTNDFYYQSSEADSSDSIDPMEERY